MVIVLVGYVWFILFITWEDKLIGAFDLELVHKMMKTNLTNNDVREEIEATIEECCILKLWWVIHYSLRGKCEIVDHHIIDQNWTICAFYLSECTRLAKEIAGLCNCKSWSDVFCFQSGVDFNSDSLNW